MWLDESILAEVNHMDRQERQVARLSQCLDNQGTDSGGELCVQRVLPLPLFDFFVMLCVRLVVIINKREKVGGGRGLRNREKRECVAGIPTQFSLPSQ